MLFRIQIPLSYSFHSFIARILPLIKDIFQILKFNFIPYLRKNRERIRCGYSNPFEALAFILTDEE